MSILSALGWRGLLTSMCIAGATDGPVFLTYLRRVLVPKLWKGAVVVMDNLGAHKVAGVQDLIENAGAKLLYLPPYSADFNPIEPAWSKFKNHLRKVAARIKRTLARAIRQGLAGITSTDARGFFKHCGHYS